MSTGASGQQPAPQPGSNPQSAPTVGGASVAVAGRPTPAPRQASPQQGSQQRTPPAQLAPAGRTMPKSSVPTPQWLRRATVSAVLLSLVTGLVALGMILQSRSALEQQQAATAQLERIQTIHTELLHADALATSSHLQGKAQPEEQGEFDASLAAASRAMISAGQAQPADQEALAALNTQVLDYARTVEQARAANRADQVVGNTYLLQASNSLRTGAVPNLEALSRANSDRITQHSSSSPLIIPILLGIATLALLIWVMVQSARRFRRVLNPGLLTAALSTLVLLILTGQQATTLNSVDGQISRSVQASAEATSTRVLANEARSQEVLSLLDGNDAATHQNAWSAAATKIEPGLNDQQQGLWREYALHHQKVVAASDAGDHELARNLAKNGATFTEFERAVAQSQQDRARISSDTSGERTTLTIVAIASGLLTALACGGAFAGLRRRTREYQ